MRQLYMAKVLPIFSYAWSAWYLPPGACCKYTITKACLKKLKTLQRDVLLNISGGMSRTSGEVLFK
jgi:hypothetical protein